MKNYKCYFTLRIKIERLERKTDLYVKLMVITFVTRDIVLLMVSTINRKVCEIKNVTVAN